MKLSVRLILGVAPVTLLTSCGIAGGDGDLDRPRAGALRPAGNVADYPVKVGEPYKVAGRTYTPQEVGSYDDVGYASWYGNDFKGNPTANGERFNPNGITAAHKTLPLPTYVEVTSLDTGKTILVRVNDRGPFANDRLIDLSEGAAKQLGMVDQGVAGVRVRKVNPPEQERSVLRAGGNAAERIETPESLLLILRKKLKRMPKPKAHVKPSRPVPVTQKTRAGASYPTAGNRPNVSTTGNRDGRFVVEGTSNPVARRPSKAINSIGDNRASLGVPIYVVQVAAFGSQARANALAKKIGATVVRSSNGSVFRVRYGPYSKETDAKQALENAKQRGYGSARILRADRP